MQFKVEIGAPASVYYSIHIAGQNSEPFDFTDSGKGGYGGRQ